MSTEEAVVELMAGEELDILCTAAEECERAGSKRKLKRPGRDDDCGVGVSGVMPGQGARCCSACPVRARFE